jgi:hypothetical protein
MACGGVSRPGLLPHLGLWAIVFLSILEIQTANSPSVMYHCTSLSASGKSGFTFNKLQLIVSTVLPLNSLTLPPFRASTGSNPETQIEYTS